MRSSKEKLRLAMAQACMSVQELADAAEMPLPTLNGAIRGRSVRPKTIGKLARALNVPVEDLLEEV